MLYRFHANVFALPNDATESATLELRGAKLPVLRTPDGRPPTFETPLPVTFEDALSALARLPRLDAEPDGFFVIAGGAGPTRWQVDGHLFDFDGRLHRVELHGACPPETFDAIISCLGWPAAPLAFELVLDGVALAEPAFRRFAGMATN